MLQYFMLQWWKIISIPHNWTIRISQFTMIAWMTSRSLFWLEKCQYTLSSKVGYWLVFVYFICRAAQNKALYLTLYTFLFLFPIYVCNKASWSSSGRTQCWSRPRKVHETQNRHIWLCYMKENNTIGECRTTLWFGDDFHIAGPLWGDSIGDLCYLLKKGQSCRTWMFFFVVVWTSCWTNINVTCNAISPETLIFSDGALSFTGIQSRGEWLGYKLSSYATLWATPIYFWFDETYCTFLKSFLSHFKRAGKVIWWTDPNFSKEPHFSRNSCFVGTKINHKIISMG